jgi:hypothetical protein
MAISAAAPAAVRRCAAPRQIAALPRQQRPERHRDHQGQKQGRESQIEKRRAD